MDERKLRRVLDQVRPGREREEAILARLLDGERTVRPVKTIKKTVAVLAAAAVMLMACAFTVATGLDQRIMDFLGMDSGQAELLSPAAVAVDVTASSAGADMTVKQVLADRYSLLMLVEFTVPEGMELERENYTFDSTVFHPINEKGETMTSFGYFPSWHMVEDRDPTDNRLEMIGRIHYGTSHVVASDDETQNDYETTLDQQKIVGVEFQVGGFRPEGTLGNLDAYKAGASEIQRRLLEGEWSVTIPLKITDPGWRTGADGMTLELGNGAAEIREIYLSPMTLHISLSGVSRDSFFGVEEETGTELLEQAVLLRDREGNELLLEEGSGGGMADFLRETTDLHYRLEELIDPAQFAGGTLTILGQTFSLEELTPVEK